MRYLNKIITLILVFSILTSFFVGFASASSDINVDVMSLGDWVQKYGRQVDHKLATLVDGDACGDTSSPNGLHKFVEQRTQLDGKVGLFYICEYCGKSAGQVFSGTGGQASAGNGAGRYQEYVSTLPTNGYSSDGSVFWYSSWDDLALRYQAHLADEGIVDYGECTILTRPISGTLTVNLRLDGTPCTYTTTTTSVTYTKGSDGRSVSVSASPKSSSSISEQPSAGNFKLNAPISGTYFLETAPAYDIRYIDSSGALHSVSGSYQVSSSGSHYSVDSPFYSPVVTASASFKCTSLSGLMYFPVYRVIPDLSADDYPTIYNSNTRMGNIGGTYCTVNNDNSVTEYTTQYIVNEGDNIYTNPATGETQPILDWTYNYDDRSYNLIFVNGDKAVVTYGNENVTIRETDGEDGTSSDYIFHYGGSSRGGGAGRDPLASPSPSPSLSPSPSIVPDRRPTCRVFRNYGATVTQAYGNNGHGGTDCIPSSGVADTVIAHSEGDVVWVQTGQDNNQGSSGDLSYGNAVKIRHSNGYYTLYAHLATVEIAQGDHVIKGQALGQMGNTGNSYGAHLHFEVRDVTDTRINSDPYLSADLPGLSTSDNSSWWSDAMSRLGAILGAPFVGELFSTVGGVFGQMWGWLPPEITAVFTVGVTFLVVAAVMKFFL